MASTAEKLDPELWEQAKADARDAFGGHSARAMQLAVKLYKQRGGRYRGPKKKDNRLTQWSRQDWKTKSGRPSRETGERYLPAAAIESLTPAEYGATTRAKRRGGGVGSVVAQPQSIREKTRKFRKVNPDMATAKQIAARKKFAERARSGELAKMRKKNPIKKPTRAASRKANPVYDRDGFYKFLITPTGAIAYEYKNNQGYTDTGYSIFQAKDKTEVYDRFTEKYVEMPKNRYSIASISKRDDFLNDLIAVTKIEDLKDRDDRVEISVAKMFGIEGISTPRRRNPTATRPGRSRTKLVSNGERKNNPMNTRLPRVSSSGMKATDKALENSVAMLSRFLDLPNWKYNDPNAIGAIGINQAYGGVQLVQLATTGGGERDLSNRMTKKELMNFLDGAIMVAEALSQK